MNPLEILKQKMKVKPIVNDRQRVDVLVKGKTEKPKSTKKVGKVEELEEGEVEEKEEDEEKAEEEIAEKTVKKAPIIVDETQLNYDRNALKNKLTMSKQLKVSVKNMVKAAVAEEPIPEIAPPVLKKAKKVPVKKLLIIEEDEEEGAEEKKEGTEEEIVPIKAPKVVARKTKKIEKGIAVLGPETVVRFGDTNINDRLPKRSPPINIKVSSYYMNDREIFVNFINSIFEPYRIELQENKDSISCEDIGKTNGDFSLLTHQKIVRDYMNLYTPYRGLLLYHGLGSGKTATSIAIAEGMKDSKRVIIMTPASLRANYI